MTTILRHPLVLLIVLAILTSTTTADPTPMTRRSTKLQPATAPSQPPSGPEKGTLLLCSLQTPEIRDRFIQLAGGNTARFVIILNTHPQGSDLNAIAIKTAFTWGVPHITVWHADDAKSAAAPEFLTALKQANAVWFTGGHPDLYADPYLDSPAQKELTALLTRGGVIGGESAGAMIQASHLMNTPNQVHSLEPAPPCYRGFGFLHAATIFPHFAAGHGKFPLADCQKLIAQNPHLLGIGIDDGAAVIVTKDQLQAIGTANVTVLYQNKRGEPRSKVLKPDERCAVRIEPTD